MDRLFECTAAVFQKNNYSPTFSHSLFMEAIIKSDRRILFQMLLFITFSAYFAHSKSARKRRIVLLILLTSLLKASCKKSSHCLKTDVPNEPEKFL